MRLRIVPGGVSGLLEGGGWRPALLARASSALADLSGVGQEVGATAAEAQDDGLADAVEKVLAELAKVAPLQGTRMEVEVADALVHLDVVAGDFAAEGDRQLQAIAEACATELLGDAAAACEVRWQLQRDGRHLLIGALGRPLVHGLSEIAQRHDMTLSSVLPDLCVQWNRHAEALRSGPAVFAVAGGREALVACVADGAITALSQGGWLDRRDSVDGAAAGQREAATATALLDRRVDRLLASQGLDPARQSSYVLVAAKGTAQGVASRWTVRDREGRAS